VQPARPPLRWRTVVCEALVVALATVAVVAVHLRLWRAAWREPWVRGSDADFYLMLARSLGEHGSYLHTANLGWPFGQDLADLPHGNDNLHLLGLRVLAVVSGGPGAAVNLFFILTFAVVAFTSHVALRKLGFSRVASGVGAFVFAFAPYHFLRGEGHLLLSGYEMVPIGVLLALALFDEPVPLLRTGGRRGLDWRSRRTWFVVIAAILLASTGPYYFVFSMMLIAIAAAFHALNGGRWRPIVSAALIIVVGVTAFAINVSPSLLNTYRNGKNEAVALRSPFETEVYGLKIFQLFVPREGHRIELLRRASDRTLGSEAFFQSESGQQLGILGAVALLVILVVVGCRLAGRRSRETSDDGDELLVSRLGLFTIACLLIGASGGISFLISAAGLRDIRAWNRISIVIAFFTVIVLAMGVDRASAWLRDRWASRPGLARWAPALIATLVVVIAFADQGGNDTPPYQAVHAKYASDSEFFATVHDRLGDGAAVFNLPYQPFPEAPPRGQIGEFDEGVGFIFQPTLNWSFGGMRGRVPDYPKVLESQPVDQWMQAIAAIGFTGIVLDRAGYTEDERAPLEAQIEALAGPPTVSADGRYAFYDLREFVADVRAELGDEAMNSLAARTLELRSSPAAP
jgi:phosphoglycerol transferase